MVPPLAPIFRDYDQLGQLVLPHRAVTDQRGHRRTGCMYFAARVQGITALIEARPPDGETFMPRATCCCLRSTIRL
ncbi:MAG: hypothetical protein ACXWKP_00385 [Bradyrhizobium sp.]